MKKYLHVATVTLFLTGCAATANKVRESPPRVFETSKHPESVANCIIEKYDGIGLQAILKMAPRGDGGKTIKVGFSQDSNTIKLLVDISPKQHGSIIRSYENLAVSPRDRKIIEECGTGAF